MLTTLWQLLLQLKQWFASGRISTLTSPQEPSSSGFGPQPSVTTSSTTVATHPPLSKPMSSTADFDLAFEFTMKEEGVKKDAQGNITSTGLNKIPGDPGGTTNFGFAQKFHPDIDVAQLTWDKAKELAYSRYWLYAGCDKFQWPENIILFDTCFNQSKDEALQLILAGIGNEMLWARLLQHAAKHPA